jgi:hypothetical protein
VGKDQPYNSTAVPAEKNVISSESSIKENSTYESNASEQTDNQRDNTSAGIADNSIGNCICQKYLSTY